MTTPKRPQFGELPPRYSFMLNPYPDMRISSCPLCEHKTGQRKIPLLIHVAPMHLLALNYTCRYCSACDLLIGHKHEIEHLLTNLFSQMDPAAVGKTAWREGLQHPKAIDDMLPHASDFAEYYQELRVTRPGGIRPVKSRR